MFIESGGDNLSATFSPELADLTIYVIDVAEGEKIPRKGGPGITRSDLLVINKIDLAPYVGASLEVMESRHQPHARRAALGVHQYEDRGRAGRDHRGSSSARGCCGQRRPLEPSARYRPEPKTTRLPGC